MTRKLLLATALLTTGLSAQTDPFPDAGWYSIDGAVTRMLTNGEIVAQAPTTNADGVYPAPDGQVWITVGLVKRIDFSSGAPVITTLPAPATNAQAAAVCFALDGTAWIAWNSEVWQTTANGVVLQQIPTHIGARDACFDSEGILWIVHSDGILTRLDPATGTMTETDLFPQIGAQLVSGMRAAPDTGNGGCLWVSADPRALIRVDCSTGLVTNSFEFGDWTITGEHISRPSIDRLGRPWVGTTVTGRVYVLQASGLGVANSFNLYPSQIRAIDISGEGEPMIQRYDVVSFSTTIETLDPITGAVRSRITPGFVRSRDPFRFHRALVYDRDSDTDGDLTPNGAETQFGSHPYDPQDRLPNRLRAAAGSQQLGGLVRLQIPAAGYPYTLLFGFGRSSSGVPVPGILGEFLLDPTSLLPVTSPGFLELPMPTDPSFAGLAFYSQAFVPGAGPIPAAFTNVVNLRVFQ